MRYEDRLIKIERIVPNPLRDFEIYPIHTDKLEKLEASYRDGDFGTIIPVRPHPVKAHTYQQACGHHRVAAMQREGKPLEILCRIQDLTDDQMVSIMVRENMNNYGNSPEALADSVASICKVLIYWMFLSNSRADFSTIVEKCLDIFDSDLAFNSAKGRLIQSSAIGEPLISNFFGSSAVDSPITGYQVKSALASLHATGKMKEICDIASIKAERELGAQKQEEKKRAEIAEKKEKEAAAELARWNRAEVIRKERRVKELKEAKAMKESLAKTQEEARIAREKTEADREIKRMKALEKERARLQREAETRRENQATQQASQDRAVKARKLAEEKGTAPYLHPATYGMFDNQGQFDVFRITLTANDGKLQPLFPVKHQPKIVARMIAQLRQADDLTAKGIKEWMIEQDAVFYAEIAKQKKVIADARQAELEAKSTAVKVERVMEDFQSQLSRMSKSFAEVHLLMEDPETAELAVRSTYSQNLRPSIESMYKILPKIEKLFGMYARRFSEPVKKRTEKSIN